MIIELATSLVFLAQSVYGPATSTPEIIESTKLKANLPLTLEDHVKDYFKDDPLLAEIAKCESNYRHFGRNGKIIRGVQNSDDVGVMQINEQYHASQSKKLGFDIYTLEGNMAYAKWLYEKQGARPWKASSKCWDDFKDELAVKK
ncbi:MAG: hypothetical protein HYV68_02715 [Candidatus Taylorbacteria bacterium]|nr:hypothetical protein [Candidatus Taylorbacteria bacterium]